MEFWESHHFLELFLKMSSIVNFEQKIIDLRQEEQRLLIIVGKGEPTDPDNRQTWQQCKAQLAEVRKRIHNLVEARYILVHYL